jgi:hypothetical protein
VRFSRKLGNQADKSPQSLRESFLRDDGNTIPFFQLRLRQDQMDKYFRKGNLPNFSAGRADRDPQLLILILSTTERDRNRSSRVCSLSQF